MERVIPRVINPATRFRFSEYPPEEGAAQYKGTPRIAPHTYGVADESLNIKDRA